MRFLGMAVVLLAACGPVVVAPPPGGTGGGADAGGAADGGFVADAGDPAPDAGLGEADGGTIDGPFAAPLETWTYVPLPDMHCANGTTTGIAVNVVAGSRELVLALQGGGACWEDFACLVGNTATHLHETVGESVVLAEARQGNFVFDRADAQNPFRNATLVYVPYCTGDLHSGGQVKTYHDAFGQPVDIHHVGARNVDAVLAKINTELPGIQRVWLAGASAGGYGAALNWWRVRAAMPAARVDVLDDSAPLVPTTGGQFATMRANWKMELPPGCTDCANGLPALLPFYAQTVPAPARFALLAYRADQTIRLFFGYPLDPAPFTAQVQANVDAMGERQRAFQLEGTDHVMLVRNPLPTTSSGVSLRDWLRDFATDAPGWTHAGP